MHTLGDKLYGAALQRVHAFKLSECALSSLSVWQRLWSVADLPL